MSTLLNISFVDQENGTFVSRVICQRLCGLIELKLKMTCEVSRAATGYNFKLEKLLALARELGLETAFVPSQCCYHFLQQRSSSSLPQTTPRKHTQSVSEHLFTSPLPVLLLGWLPLTRQLSNSHEKPRNDLNT